MEAEFALFKSQSNTDAVISISETPKKNMIQRPRKKGIAINKISQIDSDRLVTRSRAILKADRCDNGNKKIQDTPSVTLKHAQIDQILGNAQGCWIDADTDEIT